MAIPELRFCKGDMHSLLTRQAAVVAEAVRTLPPDQVLAVPIADLADHLYERHRVEPIDLQVESRTSRGAQDLTVSVDDWTGRRVNIDGSRVEIQIPFEGDAVLFDVKASRSTFNPPRFEVRRDSIIVAYEGRAPIDKAQAKASIDGDIAKIREHLGWQLADIEPWNERLRESLPGQIEERRNKVLADRELDEFLEVPIEERARPTRSFAVDPPKRKEPLGVADRARQAFSPEPAVSAEGFDAILAEIESVTTAVERLPKTFAMMPEESLRDVLLVVLNNRFGPASGETFSRNGKTDILVPWGGDQRAVFIAECKIWKGPAAFRKAVDQLLGYITWRDTHAALILFVRSGSPSEIATKAEAGLTDHAHFKRKRDVGARPTFTLSHPDDSEREIHVALMVIPVLA